MTPSGGSTGSDMEVRIEIVGDLDDHELDRLHRTLRSDLDENGLDASLVHESPVGGSKSGVGVITGVVVPLLSAVTPVLGTTLSVWLTQRRGRCTLRLTGPQDSVIELPAVELEELEEVLKRWRAAAGAADGA